MGKILVTGGCGYIGVHTVVDLIENGYDVISVDNFLNSSDDILEGVAAITGKRVKNYNVDLCHFAPTRRIFEENPDISGVIHFAAYKAVGESFQLPLEYHRNNLISLINILQCIEDFKVENFIFSSSCSVYGNSKTLPVTEDTVWEQAESPYGRSKQFSEGIIRDFQITNPSVRTISLRYFNPAGAHESGLIGEASPKVLNLVPILNEVATGKRAELKIFGDDYDTRDGSCVRDYIHVVDLAHAHTLSLQRVDNQQNEGIFEVFNLGIGEGATVFEAIAAFEKANGVKIPFTVVPRRAGDIAAVYANNDKAKKVLGWQPRYGMEDIMRTAWAYENKRHTEGVAI